VSDTRTGGDDEEQPGIPHSKHARLRSGQGRPISQVVNDVQRASRNDVFVQVEDQRFVVRGPRGREHVLEKDGELVTSLRRSDAAHEARLRSGVIRSATDEEFRELKQFLD
jgi:hypothetical protein